MSWICLGGPAKHGSSAQIKRWQLMAYDMSLRVVGNGFTLVGQ